MFTGRYEPIPGIGERTQVTPAQSMTATFKADYLEPFNLIPGMEKEKRESMAQNIESLKLTASRGEQGIIQKSGNWLAGMAGAILNPLSLATGEVAGAGASAAFKLGAAKKISAFTGKYLPSATTALLNRPIGEIIKSRVPGFLAGETIAKLAQKSVSGFAMGTGFALPGEIAKTYNPKSDDFNWYKGIKASFEDGGFGLLLMSAPYLGGILWSKLFRGAADHAAMPLPGEAAALHAEAKTPSITEEHVDKAVKDKWLTPHEGEWVKDYFFKKDTHENLSNRATEMLIRDGHPVDARTNQVLHKILHADDVQNMQTGLMDGVAASHMSTDMKNLVTDFVAKNRMDGSRENPDSVVDGLRGVVSFTRKRLEKTPEELVNFNKIMRKLLPENLKEENPFTQHKIAQIMKKEGATGLTVPEQVERHLAQSERIRKLEQQTKDYEKQFAKTGKKKYETYITKANEKVEKLKSSLQPLLKHKEEIEHLRGKLLPNGKVLENFKSSREYQRLHDLTRVRNDARRLLHELNLRNEHELHEAYATVLDTLTKVMRSEFGKYANPENINNYMKERLSGSFPFKHLELKDVQAEVKIAKERITKAHEETRTPEKREEVTQTLDEEMKQSEAKEIKEEYQEIKNQFDEFKANESVFANLIKCALGAFHG